MQESGLPLNIAVTLTFENKTNQALNAYVSSYVYNALTSSWSPDFRNIIVPAKKSLSYKASPNRKNLLLWRQ